MSQPKISVIIPVYNVEEYLQKCLDSVVNQTLKDIEIICINDGSTDNSLQILEEYAQKDSRIIVINQQNQGVAAARNKGLEIARGDYIWFVDSDDYVERNGLDYVYKKSKENNADIVCFGVNNICKSTIISGHTNQYLSEINMTCQIDLNIKKHFLHNIWDKLFSRKFIQNIIKFPNGILTAEDGIFNLFCLYKEPKYLFINKILYNYRTDRNLSATNDKKNVINNDLKAFKYITTSNAFQSTNEPYKIITIDKFIDGILYYFYKYENKDYELLYIKQIEEYKNYITQNIDKEILNKCNNIKSLKKLTYAKFILRQLFSISNKNNNGKKEKLIIILGRHFIWSSNKNNFLRPKIKSNFESIEELKNTHKNKYKSYIRKFNIKKKCLTAQNQTNKQPVNIVLLLDNDYFFCTFVALKSMKANKDSNSCYKIFILSKSLLPENKEKLTTLKENNFSIEIIDVEKYCIKYKEIQNILHISNTALIKFDIANILNNIDKVLYLDGDVLVTKDLSNLFNTDINEFFLGAIREIRAEKNNYNKLVGTEYYFNSGVMLLNLKKIREENIAEKLINVKLHQPSTWYCMDQDVFNNVLGNKFKVLPPKYNNTVAIFIESEIEINEINNFYSTTYKNLKEFCKDSTIIHFAGKLKPWIFDIGYLSKLYKKYSHADLNLKHYKYKNSFTENIFSLRNSQDNTNKIITICGIKFKVKRNICKKFPSINKPQLLKEINSNKNLGTNKEKRTPQLIVSLTSFPQRMYDIHFCLYSLLNQSLKPDRLILRLAEEEFPNKEKDIPNTVLSFLEKGLEIKWCKNIKSYKKLIPALKEYPDAITVTADDDIYYPVDWLEKLYQSYQKNPEYIHCHRAHKILFDSNKKILPYKMWEHETYNQQPDYINFFTGSGGVLYPQGCLNTDVLNEELFTKLAPNADDIWFWAMAVLQGTKIKVVDDNIKQLTYINPERELGLNSEITLCSQNCGNGQNDVQLANVLKQYPQIMEKLINE